MPKGGGRTRVRSPIQKEKTNMPHDAYGNLLKVGDQVVIPGVLTNIGEDGGYCNVSVETEHVMPGSGLKSTVCAINAAQVEKAFGVAEGLEDEDRAKVAYQGYCSATGGKSLISGDKLPEFEVLKPEIRAAWVAAANAVRDQIFAVTPAPAEKV